jgi:hypothetical protein
MAAPKRMMAVVITVLAVGLTVFGVVVAATNSTTSTVRKDPLALNGYPPKSTDLFVTLTTGSGVTLNANVEVNFTTDRVAALVHFPLVITTASVNVLLLKDHVYARSADVSNGPWLSAKRALPNLYGISLEMTKPDIDLITGFKETTSKRGYSTTYVFTRHDVALSHLFAGAKANSVLGSVRWSITVGSQGELTQTSLLEQTKHSTLTLSATVLSYNQPVHVVQPSTSQSEPLSRSVLAKLLSSTNFAALLIPSALFSQTLVS